MASSPATDSGRARDTLRALKTVLLLFVITRVLVFSAACIIASRYPASPEKTSSVWHGDTEKQGAFLEPWRRWDALWFLNVAREGYSYRADAQSNVTVFPLYPLAIRAVGGIVGSRMLAGVIVSNLCLLILTYLIYVLALDAAGGSAGDVTNGSAALGSLLFLYSFPTAFLLSGVYSESLFMALCAAAFLFARKRRWLLCAAAAALCCATRLVGLIILPALIAEYLSQRRWKISECRADILFLLIAPLGLFLYFLYLHHLTGDFLVYFKAQRKWGHHLASPFFSISYELGMTRNFWTYLNLSTCAVFPLLGYIALRGMRASYGLFALGIVIVSMSATNLNGVPRYVLVAFPAFMALGKFIRPAAARAALCALLLATQGYCMLKFISWNVSF